LQTAAEGDEYCFPSNNSIAVAAKECPAYPASSSCVYEDGLFQSEVTSWIQDHDTAGPPMFLFWALHIVHAPLQVPKVFLDAYADVATDDWRRQRYLAMVRYMDKGKNHPVLLSLSLFALN
jgi:hypothetical protein